MSLDRLTEHCRQAREFFPLAVAAAPPGWRGGRWTPSRDRSPPGVPSGMSKDSARHADPDDAALRPTGTAWTGTRRVTPLRHAGHHPRAVGPGGADNAAARRVGAEGERDRGRHSAGLAPSPERPGPWRVTYGRLGRAPGRLVRAGPCLPELPAKSVRRGPGVQGGPTAHRRRRREAPLTLGGRARRQARQVTGSR